MNPIDILGWIGTVLSLTFYLLLAVKKVLPAYIALALSAVVWTLVGLLVPMTSLVVKEVIVGAFVVWGYSNWKNRNI
jgi:hypothetical protein